MQKTAALRTGSTEPDALRASLEGLLRDWLPEQRWFAAKGRPITALGVITATELHPGCLHLLIRTGHDGVPDGCYQLLLGAARDLPARLGGAVLGRASTGPLAGLAVYDALHEPRAAARLLDRIRTPGTLGPLRFAGEPGAPGRPRLTPRVLDAEQSNTSLVYGNTFVLKVFRRIRFGIHPELEVPQALAREGCARVPAPVAWMSTEQPRQATLAVLQPFLPDATDGWTLALRAVAEGRGFTDEAHELGRATAEVHLALSTALPPAADAAHRRVRPLAAAMAERLDETARHVDALLPYAPRLRAAYDAAARLDTHCTVQRIHGDLHLGQVLRAAGRWHLIDFEGEPARPLAERRRTQPCLRDVAGMFRSFEYAARTRKPWRPQWAQDCREAFCDGYAAAGGRDPRTEPELLRAYETDRAVYEVLYESRHRPSWLPVPMASISRLADPGRPAETRPHRTRRTGEPQR